MRRRRRRREVRRRYALEAKIPEFVKVGEKGKHFKESWHSTLFCAPADVIFDAAAGGRPRGRNDENGNE